MLDYLFEAHLTDGTLIQQTQEDVSSVRADKSAFYDVAQRLEEVAFFGLLNEKHTFVVDLRDGHFEVDGVVFDLHPEPSLEIPAGTPYRLIYFRHHKRHFSGVVEIAHEVTYHLGWQITVAGKNYQQTLAVK